MFPLCSVDGPTLTVRKFTHRYTSQELVDTGTLTKDLANLLTDAVGVAATCSPVSRITPPARPSPWRSTWSCTSSVSAGTVG